MEQHKRAEEPIKSILRELLGVHDDVRAWRRGAEGEEKVGWWLAKLPPPWQVWHDLPIGTRGSNVDHLVVGPGGVFSINTKRLGSKVWVAPRQLRVGGRKTGYLPEAVREATRVEAHLLQLGGPAIAVSPVLAIICDEWTIKEAPADVAVVFNKGLLKWLKGQPPILDESQIRLISAAVDRWHMEAA